MARRPVAATDGIGEVIGGVLPAAKAGVITGLQASGRPAAGDGEHGHIFAMAPQSRIKAALARCWLQWSR